MRKQYLYSKSTPLRHRPPPLPLFDFKRLAKPSIINRSANHSEIQSHRNSEVSVKCIPMQKQSVSVDMLETFLAFYSSTEQMFKGIQQQCIRLEMKIATIQKQFNEIELFLVKRSNEIGNTLALNSHLIEVNAAVENRLALLKENYELFKREKYVTVIQERLRELKDILQTNERTLVSQESLNFECHTAMDRHTKRLDQHLSKGGSLEDCYKTTIIQIMGLVNLPASAKQFLYKKVIQNLELKRQLLQQSAPNPS